MQLRKWLAVALVLQFMCAAAALGLVFSFTRHLHEKAYSVAQTFIFFQGATISVLVIIPARIALTIIFKLRQGHYMAISAITSLLWISMLITSLLRMRSGLFRPCSTRAWGSAKGVAICRMYNALFAALAAGCLSALTTFVLDIVVWKTVPRKQYIHNEEPELEERVGLVYRAADIASDVMDSHEPYRGSGEISSERAGRLSSRRPAIIAN